MRRPGAVAVPSSTEQFSNGMDFEHLYAPRSLARRLAIRERARRGGHDSVGFNPISRGLSQDHRERQHRAVRAARSAVLRLRGSAGGARPIASFDLNLARGEKSIPCAVVVRRYYRILLTDL
jgi:hypothetical protein